MIRLGYSALGIAITPLLRGWLLRRAARGKEDRTRLHERFGYPSTPRPAGQLIWLHAASVGETQSVLTLVRALLAQHPQMTLLVTTGTVTSAALLASQQLPRVIHQFVPVDTYPAVKRFLTHWRPDMALWVESELWPQLLWQVRRRTIPMLLINARMSVRSMKGWKKWPRTIVSLLSCFRSIYAGSPLDAQHFSTLGAPRVIDAGNLKYDAAPLPVDDAALQQLLQHTHGRDLWVAASTHPGEESIVAEAHAIAAQQFTSLLCILIPRHAVRGDQIAADLRAAGYSVAQRSKQELPSASTQFYLADTMGELGIFYHMAPIVFLGGSLVAVGGHNPLEPARMNTAIISGAYTHNFIAMMDTLRDAHAIRIVEDKAALAQTLLELLGNPIKREMLAANALRVVQQSRGTSTQILEEVRTLLVPEAA